MTLEIVRALFAAPVGRAGPLRVGLEVEVLPVRAADRAPVAAHDAPEGSGTLGVLRTLARARRWREEDTGYGVPRFRLPDGAVVSYEPGGQLEYASVPHPRLDTLDAAVRECFARLADAMEPAGIHLVARGMDPLNPIERAPMVMDGERYRRQRAHYDRAGSAGRSMMLQTAGIHVNLDHGEAPAESWRAANALTPLLVALFANSPVRPGAAGPHRSHRAATWRTLDASRTGVFGGATDPAAEYHAFAMRADAFLLGAPGEEPRPFVAWHDAGATDEDFARHLTTLFPEVRPRGYLEIRSVDSLPARWCIVPAAVTMAVVHHAPTRHAFLREMPAPSIERLARAGRAGLGDAGLRAEADWLRPRVQKALEALAPGGAGEAADTVRARVTEFFDTFASAGRDPGHADAERVEA